MGWFGGVYVSAIICRSEPTWMKSGALWVHSRALALADFGHNPCSSDSSRCRQNFLSDKWCMMSPISRQLNFTKFDHNNVNRCCDENFRNRILKFYHKGSFFQRKCRNFLQDFNYVWLQATITTEWLQIPKIHYQMIPLVSIFTFRINSKSPLGCTLRNRNLSKFLATSDVRYLVNQVCRCAAWLTDMEEKQTWVGNWN